MSIHTKQTAKIMLEGSSIIFKSDVNCLLSKFQKF